MSRAVTRRLRSMVASAMAIGLGASCTDSTTAPNNGRLPQVGAFVVAAPSAAAAPTAYVSLPPGSIPGGTAASLRVGRTGETVVVPLVDGGFDPIALAAVVGDGITIDVHAPGAALAFASTVPRPSRPVVVRTSPPAHKRDVPLNASVVVVFSEPIDPTTLTGATVQLRKGSVAVAGRAVFTDAAHVTAQFVPAAPLDASTDYELVVTQGVRNLGGLPLAADVTVAFTTGTSAETQSSDSGSLQIRAATAGSELDTDGYVLMVDDAYGYSAALVPPALADAPATLALPAGTYTIVLSGVAVNCAVSGGATRRVEVVAKATAEVSFDVTCAPLPPVGAVSRGQLAFVNTSDFQIYLIDSDRTGLVRLTGSSVNYAPAWSPDGERIAFTSGRDGESYQIYVMNADGSNVVQRTRKRASGATPPILQATEPSWSPDGKRIAFACLLDAASTYQVCAVDADGDGSVVVLTDAGGVAPTWSLDGTRIAFASGSQRTYGSLSVLSSDIYFMSASGGPRTRLTYGLGYDGAPVEFDLTAWSPDGRRIAADTCPFPFRDYCVVNSTIVAMSADGSAMTRLAQPSGMTTGLSWSPDGRTIAFSAQPFQQSAAAVEWVSADGSGEHGVIVLGGMSPAWRPAH